jgi:hypothetical protein
MKSLSLLVVCTLAWLAWIPAVLLQKKARGDGRGTSMLPVIPLFPVGGWLAGLCLDRLSPGVGLYLVGGAHLLLTVVFLGSALISVAKIGAGGGRGFAAGGRDRKVS